MSTHDFLINGDTVETKVERSGEGFRVTVGEKTFDILPLGGGLYATYLNGRMTTMAAAVNRGVTYVDIDSVVLEVTEASDDYAGGAGDALGEKDKIMAPMPGKVVKIMVEVGDKVEARQQVVIVEAMKMENPVLAPAAGKVKAVNFAAGDQVDTDSPIVELDLDEE
ncbi:hypothetical protein GF377_01820 [candidate division GN15 bacterium]|nr:hypothetical protein [candidate division GN15 bacterium]